MNTFKKITLTSAVAFALFAFNACGDDSNSTSALGENGSSHMSSSTPIEDLDESSSSINDNSSSSVYDGDKSNSSSSRKVNSTNSSSSINNDPNSSTYCPYCDCQDGDTRTNLVSNAVMFYYHCESGEWIRDSLVSLIDTSETWIPRPNLDSLFNPDVEYGVFKDERDGHTYKTITFVATDKSKYEMFAENLNYGTFVKHDEETDVEVRKYCYDDDEWYCEHLGGLYTWSEAMRLPRACDTVFWGGDGCPSISKLPWQGICPEGWKVADNDMFEDAYKVKGSLVSILSKSGWTYSKDNTNSLGLSIYATGTYTTYSDLPYRGQFENLHLCASFWDPRIQNSDQDEIFGAPNAGAATICAFKFYPKAEFEYESNYCTDALSIRCVREIVE